MAREERPRIEIDRQKEMRTEEISKMIDEGGLGVRSTHYDIVKNASSTDTKPGSTVGTVLNELVANQGVFYVKLHQYHWYVTGSDFYTLHDKFEELYNDATEYFDAFAERLVSIGEKPYSTLAEFIEHASIDEQPYNDHIPGHKMVENVIHDFEQIKEIALQGIELAGEANDPVSEDMFIDYVDYIDKTNWMLNAFIN